MAEFYNPLPGIETYQENRNPIVCSPNCSYVLPFYQTKESLLDIDRYRTFLKNCESRFRHSMTYSNYKGFLIGLGLDRCQVHGFITSEMSGVDLEMHHTIITLFDICLIITEHLLNTVGYVTTFDVVQLLKEEHKAHNVPLVMLSKTPHEIYHSNPSSFYIHPKMVFGNWGKLLEKYRFGLTQDISFKILYYLKRSFDENGTNDKDLLALRDKIKEWSNYNGDIS